MTQGFGRYQKSMGLLLMICAFMVIPLSAGIVLISQLSRGDKQISAAMPISRCDLNADGKVDNSDFEIAAVGFGKVTQEAGNSSFDFDSDGWINSGDLEAIEKNSSLCTSP